MYRVLLVEDEDIIRKGLMFLANWPSINCEVVGEANDGQDGADKIMLLKPDIVITSSNMHKKQ
jgi:two-component system response regulator YesN